LAIFQKLFKLEVDKEIFHVSFLLTHLKPYSMKKFFYSLIFICISLSAFGQTDTLIWTPTILPNTDTTAHFTTFTGFNVFDTILNSGDINHGPDSAWNLSNGGYPQVSNNPVNITNVLQLFTRDSQWNTSDSARIIFKFTKAGGNHVVSNLTFRIGDVDKATSSNSSYIDSVSVTGYAGGVKVLPDPLTLVDPAAGYTLVNGNAAYGNPVNGLGGNCPNAIATDPSPTPLDASVNVHFSSNIDSLVIWFGDPDSIAGAKNGANQVITIDTIYFSDGGLLPVQLGNFTGLLKDEDVILNWNTLSELNNDHFDVQRSNDGSHFTSIGTVPGMGTTNIPHQYTFTDNIKEITSPSVYYRLNQVNLDGSSAFSKIIEVKLISGDITVQNVYPNPFVDRVQLQMNFNQGGVATVHLYDPNGTEVYHSQKMVSNGTNSMTLNNLANLPRGLYIIEVTVGNSVYRDKLLKQ
jgi:hypothetical protein